MVENTNLIDSVLLVTASENGFEGGKSDEHAAKEEDGAEKPSVVENDEDNDQPPTEEIPETMSKEKDNHAMNDTQEASVEGSKTDNAEEKPPSEWEGAELPSQEHEQPLLSEDQTTSSKMEVPNDKVM